MRGIYAYGSYNGPNNYFWSKETDKDTVDRCIKNIDINKNRPMLFRT